MLLYVYSTNGTATMSVVVPDTITSWVATAFAVSQDTGLGITDQPTKVGF